jgi:hypothetical protein
MARTILADVRIKELVKLGKTVTLGSKRPSHKGKHLEWDYDLVSEDGMRFTVFVRQNTILHDSFSCGLCWISPSGEHIVLMRCNGGSHPHPNRIEGTQVPFGFHIHWATERYMRRGKPDGYAIQTDLYSDIDGALKSLTEECCISGIDGLPGKMNFPSPRQLEFPPWTN